MKTFDLRHLLAYLGIVACSVTMLVLVPRRIDLLQIIRPVTRVIGALVALAGILYGVYLMAKPYARYTTLNAWGFVLLLFGLAAFYAAIEHDAQHSKKRTTLSHSPTPALD